MTQTVLLKTAGSTTCKFNEMSQSIDLMYNAGYTTYCTYFYYSVSLETARMSCYGHGAFNSIMQVYTVIIIMAQCRLVIVRWPAHLTCGQLPLGSVCAVVQPIRIFPLIKVVGTGQCVTVAKLGQSHSRFNRLSINQSSLHIDCFTSDSKIMMLMFSQWTLKENTHWLNWELECAPVKCELLF